MSKAKGKKSRFFKDDIARVTNYSNGFHEGELVSVTDPVKNSNHEIEVTNGERVGFIPTKYLKKVKQ